MDDWDDYSSGPFCRHWDDYTCAIKCAACGQRCFDHDDDDACDGWVEPPEVPNPCLCGEDDCPDR